MTDKERTLTPEQLAQIEREVLATKARPRYKLPASWWDQSTAENMSAWLDLHVPNEERLNYAYGRPLYGL